MVIATGPSGQQGTTDLLPERPADTTRARRRATERGHFCPQVGARGGGGQKCPIPLGFEPALVTFQMNPKGIPPQSPGLRAASYLGKSGWCRPTPTGLKIARTPTQGSLEDSVAGLEDTIFLGLQNRRSFRGSVGQWPRTKYPKGSGSNPNGIGPEVCPTPEQVPGNNDKPYDLPIVTQVHFQNLAGFRAGRDSRSPFAGSFGEPTCLGSDRARAAVISTRAIPTAPLPASARWGIRFRQPC